MTGTSVVISRLLDHFRGWLTHPLNLPTTPSNSSWDHNPVRGGEGERVARRHDE